MEGITKIIMALNVLEEKANLSPDCKIELDYILEDPALFDFLSKEDEALLLNKFHKEKIINLIELRDLDDGNLCFREIEINLKNLRVYRNILSPSENQADALSSIILPDTKWEQIIIRFIDGHNIEISVHKTKIRTDYKVLGFENKRALKPNTLWELLKDISENNGEIFWGDRIASDKIKKQKENLSKSLKKCFKINDDPFYLYNKERGYRIKLKFASDPIEIIKEKKGGSHDKRFDDIDDYLKSCTPSI